MPHRIVIVGSTNVDYVMKLPRLPGVGDCVSDGAFVQAFGGKGANTAVAAARVGPSHRTTFVTSLGNDTNAPLLVDAFKKDGIDTTHVLLSKSNPTGAALIMLDAQGRNYLCVAPGSNYDLTPAELDRHAAVLRTAAVVVMQLEIPVETIRRVLAICDEASVPVLMNYAPVRSTELAVDGKMTGLVVNEPEASQLSGVAVTDVPSAKAAAHALLAKGPKFVVVTLGPLGSYLAAPGIDLHQPAFKVDAVDTTAAGDTFCGALAVALADDRPLPEAVRFATAASALTCTRLGAMPSIPMRAEVDLFLKKQK